MLNTFILAGGLSKRFGSNKLLYVLNGQRLIDIVVENARPFSRNVYLVVKEKEPYQDVDCDGILTDVFEERASIIGLFTALLKSGGEDILVLSGDMPFIDTSTVSLLFKEHFLNYTIFKVNDITYPFPGIYSYCLTLDLYRFIKGGGRSIKEFLKHVNGKVIEGKDTKHFLNINRKEDVELFNKLKI